MLPILQRMYDLTPNNPVTITDGIQITCSDPNAIYPIGGEYVRHAFSVIQDTDIVVKNASNETISLGTDFFITARAKDVELSKQYSTAIYSGIKFKVTGTYTVTSFISVGTYPRAGWFNYILDAFLYLKDTTVAALSSAVSSLQSAYSNLSSTVSSLSEGLSSEISRSTEADETMQAAIEAHTANTTDAHGAVSTATANKHMVRDSEGRVQVVAGAADLDVVNKAQMAAALEALSLAAGSGNVTTTDTSATDGEIVVESGTTGKAIKKSGTLLSTILNYFNGTNEAVSLFAGLSRRITMHSVTGTTNILTQIQADFTSTGAGLKFYAPDNTCGGLPITSYLRMIAFGTSTNIKVFAVPATASKALWMISYASSAWDSTWTQLLDPTGNAIAANNVYMTPSGAALQSGTMTNGTEVTANYSGHVYINGNVTTESVASFYIADVMVDSAWANVAFTKTLPIKGGQTFKVYCGTGIASCYYAIRASK